MASKSIYMEGFRSFKKGKRIEDNPFHIELEEEKFMEWEDGFLEASFKASKEAEHV